MYSVAISSHVAISSRDPKLPVVGLNMGNAGLNMGSAYAARGGGNRLTGVGQSAAIPLTMPRGCSLTDTNQPRLPSADEVRAGL